MHRRKDHCLCVEHIPFVNQRLVETVYAEKSAISVVVNPYKRGGGGERGQNAQNKLNIAQSDKLHNSNKIAKIKEQKFEVQKRLCGRHAPDLHGEERKNRDVKVALTRVL